MRAPAPAPDRIATLRQAYALLQADRFAEAQQALARLPHDAQDLEAALLRGLAAGAQAQTEPAATLLARVARARPAHAHPARDLVAVLRRTGRGPDAEPVLRALLAADPADPRLHGLLAEWLYEQGRPEEAIAPLEAWLRLAPAAFEAHSLLGAVLADLGRMAEAAARFRHAIALAPGNATGWANLGVTLKTEGRFDESLAAHREAVQRRPQDTTIRLNHAIALLRAGRLAQGWAEFEARLATPGHTTLPPARLLPTLATLRGGIAGRTVLVTHEEGFGDTLQFVRYVPLLLARGARVLLSVPRELARLLRAMPDAPGLEVIAGDAQWLPHYDWHCPVLSLPRAFGTTLETVPAALPYLRADPALVHAWGPRLPPRAGVSPGQGLRVGLAWAGQARTWQTGFAAIDRRRSTTLASLAPLFDVPGLCLVSLQKGGPPPEPPPGRTLCDPMPGVTDFADTAAIIAGLDVVVSVDTAVVHLAGALGKPVLLLDRYDSCWRWLSHRTDSPWYPRLQVFRQQRMGDWPEVVGRVARTLQKEAGRRVLF